MAKRVCYHGNVSWDLFIVEIPRKPRPVVENFPWKMRKFTIIYWKFCFQFAVAILQQNVVRKGEANDGDCFTAPRGLQLLGLVYTGLPDYQLKNLKICKETHRNPFKTVILLRKLLKFEFLWQTFSFIIIRYERITKDYQIFVHWIT